MNNAIDKSPLESYWPLNDPSTQVAFSYFIVHCLGLFSYLLINSFREPKQSNDIDIKLFIL